jgi:S-adenosylmethionine:tRNA ribosyltransferase-isomerase
LKLEDQIVFGHGLLATVRDKQQDGQILFAFSGFAGAFETALEAYGQMPLPPYIAGRRAADAKDRTDYQTAYATKDGSVAAPTAGLHFTDALMAQVKAQGVTVAEVTLHVGAGTFLPMKVDDTRDHVMHAEWGTVSAEVAAHINMARSAGGRLICVGTTSLRLIETAADNNGQVQPFTGETNIFITPGYRFKVADMLMTNFHLPKSTLFMLVGAFAGVGQMKAAYAHAIDREYRFYSYGDSSLLYRHD